jgi:O-antigen ligase
VAIPFNIIRSKKILKGVLISFIISGFIMAVMGVISIKDQNIFYDPFRFTVLTINGAKPFGLDQNLLVETLLPAIFFLLAIRLWPRQSVKYKLTVLLLLFFGLVLLGTFSRGAWISILVCSVLYLLYQKKLNLQKLIIGGSMVMVLLLPLFIHMYQLQTNYKVGIGSTQTRWLSTQIAWKTFKDNIWVGRGTGEYENMLNDSIRFRARHGLGTDSNGIFQKVMAENGLIGLVTLTILVITIFRHLYIQLRKQTESNDFVLPIYLAALSIFIFEMVNTSYYHGKLWLPIAIALSASAIVEKK